MVFRQKRTPRSGAHAGSLAPDHGSWDKVLLDELLGISAELMSGLSAPNLANLGWSVVKALPVGELGSSSPRHFVPNLHEGSQLRLEFWILCSFEIDSGKRLGCCSCRKAKLQHVAEHCTRRRTRRETAG